MRNRETQSYQKAMRALEVAIGESEGDGSDDLVAAAQRVQSVASLAERLGLTLAAPVRASTFPRIGRSPVA